jgi:alanine racemase
MQHVEGRPTVAEVSLGALRENCRQAVALVGTRVAVLAVVKADGYGHGAVPARASLLEAAPPGSASRCVQG